MKRTMFWTALAAALLLQAGLSSAQPSPRGGNCAAAGASAAPGNCPGPGGGSRGRWGRDHTPGWGLMTPGERNEHQNRMSSMHNAGECKAYMEQHHAQMTQRAKDKGVAMPAKPRGDACAGMKGS